MVRTHYPSYIKTIHKAGAIFHLMFLAGGMFLGWTRTREYWKNSRPKRNWYRAGKFDANLQVRDQRAREVWRRQLDWQPNDARDPLTEYKVCKPLSN
jgi:hypothetical protein